MNWADIFIHDTTWVFAFEILIRVIVMFLLIISFLRLTGKRGVRQLSVFELTIILSVGSIAGDPMFTEDLPIIQAVLIMSTVIFLYRLCTWAMMKFQSFENILEGQSLYIVEEGKLVLDKIKKGKMSHDEFFSEMRRQGIEHLGQVRTGLLETDGNFSILLYPPEKTGYGLPLFPKQYQPVEQIELGVYYACMHCGYVEHISDPNQLCRRCEHKACDWAEALNSHIVR